MSNASNSTAPDTSPHSCDSEPKTELQEVAEFAIAFGACFKSALQSTEDAEIFNAALEFAERSSLSVSQMARVLLMTQPRVPRSALRLWVRDAPNFVGKKEPDATKDPAMPDWFVTSELQLHSASIPESEWKYSDIAAELVTSFRMMNGHFFGGQLPPAPISFDWASNHTLGSYRLNRDGLALNHRINLNPRYAKENSALRHAVLLHEMIHLWEHVIKGRETGGNYHTRQFCSLASDLGIPTNSRGEYLGIQARSPFAHWLAVTRRVETRAELIQEPVLGHAATPKVVDPRLRSSELRRSRSHLARWTCGCERKVWVSGGQDLKAHCCVCDQPFVRS